MFTGLNNVDGFERCSRVQNDRFKDCKIVDGDQTDSRVRENIHGFPKKHVLGFSFCIHGLKNALAIKIRFLD